MGMRLGGLAAAVAAVLLTGTSFVQAAPLLALDYNGQWGNGTEPGFTGVPYNQCTNFTTGGYTITTNGTTYAGGVADGPAKAFYGDWVQGIDTGWWNCQPLTISVAGLATSTQYELKFYSWSSSYPETLRYYAAGDSSKTTLGTIVWNNTVPPDFNTNPCSTTFLLTTDASGVLSATAEADPDGGRTVVVVNGFTVSEVPEPASIALLGLSGLALLRRKH